MNSWKDWEKTAYLDGWIHARNEKRLLNYMDECKDWENAAHLLGWINGRIDKRQLIYMGEFMVGMKKGSSFTWTSHLYGQVQGRNEKSANLHGWM